MRSLVMLVLFIMAPPASSAAAQCHGRPAWDEPVAARTQVTGRTVELDAPLAAKVQAAREHARAAARAGDDDVDAQLEAAWQLLPEPRAQWNASFALANDAVELHFEARRHDEALRWLARANRALDGKPNSEILMWLGRIHADQRRFGDAYACFEAARAAWGMQAFDARPGDERFRRFFETQRLWHDIDAPDGPSARQTIGMLEHEDADDYFDRMHGNAHPLVQRLMMLRFDATKDVVAAIDRLERDGKREALVAALYRVLAFVKDPASIPWLARRLGSTDAARVHDRIVGGWQSNVRGAGYGTSKWLTGHAQWVAFWIGRHRTASTPEHRAQALDVLRGFDHADAVRFFTGQRAVAGTPIETLIVETYLHVHDVPLDAARVSKALAEMGADDADTDYVIDLADEARHDVFVPWLIRKAYFVEPYTVPARHPAQDVLEAITCTEGISGADAWRPWFAAHGHEGRDAWRKRAEDEFRRLLRANEDAALARFDVLSYSWDDIAWLPLVAELASRPKFQGQIAGWINMTYTAYLRPRLEPLARAIAQDPAALEDHARRLLERRGFLPDTETWSAHVQRANSRL